LIFQKRFHYFHFDAVKNFLCVHTGPGVDSASNRNEYQESLKIKKPGGKVRQARKADNLAAIY
jgi:hypothetical protein